MFQYKGIWLPEGETHFQIVMDSRKSPMRDGKATYQWRKLKKSIKFTPPARRVAIDIGSNVGFFSMWYVQVFDKVHAFEPIEEYRACFKKNLEPHQNYVLHEVALGETELEWPMIGTEGHSGNTYLDPDYEGDEDDIDLIEVVPLDSYQFEEVDLIKIDCEGYEQHVVEGARQTILRNRPVIMVEQKPGWPSLHDLPEMGAVDLLRDLGMKLIWEQSGDYILVWPEINV